MSNYAIGQCDAALAFGFDKEAALDFLGPEVAKYMRRTLLAIPFATAGVMHQMPAPQAPQAPSVIAYRGTPRHHADVAQTRGKVLTDLIKAQQAAAAAPPTVASSK